MSSNTFPPVLEAASLGALAIIHIAELQLGTRCYVIDQDQNYYLVDVPSLVPNGTTIIRSAPGAIVGRPGALWATEDAISPPVPPSLLQTAFVALGTDETTSSAAFVAIPGLSLTITTAANRVIAQANVVMNIAVSDGEMAIFLDGVQMTGISTVSPPFSTANVATRSAVLTAGSHTFDVRWKTTGGAPILCNAASQPAFYSATLLLQEVAV